VTYSKVQSTLGDVKAFCKAQKHVQDKRKKAYPLVCEQLDEAYRTLCVAANHLAIAERYGKTKEE
jgi:hypothetical protein